MKHDSSTILFWPADRTLQGNIANEILVGNGSCILLWNKKFSSCERNWSFPRSIFRLSCDYRDNVPSNSARKCAGFAGYLEKSVDEKSIFFSSRYVILWVLSMWSDYSTILCSKRARCRTEKSETGGSGAFVREECGCALCLLNRRRLRNAFNGYYHINCNTNGFGKVDAHDKETLGKSESHL